ncbi:MAG: DUF1501 domain-containing protein [Alphaproteobacteria bacterium]|nr:DUF1501 domain-containing protein [Alphaproteobacteria bacterium]
MDGLTAIAPVGDPNYAELRGSLALARSGDRGGLILDDFFAAHPSLQTFARLYKIKQAAVVHAVATPYRDRSHFDGQDVLESGYPAPGHTDSGWLNRAVAQLPSSSPGASAKGLGVGAAAPLVMRGPARVLGWAPQGLPEAGAGLAQRVLDLYAHRDPVLADALKAGLDTERLAQGDGVSTEMMKQRNGAGKFSGMRQAAAGAARLLAAPDGPRIAAIAFDGFDTHANEGGAQGQLAVRLSGLDAVFEELEKGLGDAWNHTIVVAVTEFGRTARANGTNGTDHGTASAALLAGGALAGGRVITEWPGLGQSRLYQGRDLSPTTDMRAVLKGLLAEHIGMSDRALAEIIFPDSTRAAPMRGLLSS